MRRIPPACCARAAGGHPTAPAKHRYQLAPSDSDRHVLLSERGLPNKREDTTRRADCLHIREETPAPSASATRSVSGRPPQQPVAGRCPLCPLSDRDCVALQCVAKGHLRTHAAQQICGYSITSSASCRKCKGTSRPSVLAVERLIRPLYQQIAWLCPLQNFPDVAQRELLINFDSSHLKYVVGYYGTTQTLKRQFTHRLSCRSLVNRCAHFAID
jgi:hypothetical protein